MLQTKRCKKIRDEVAERIKSLIVAAAMRPGDRLPTENELAERFGFSRLSVREATKALEFLGILESKPGVGLTVGRVNLARVTDHLGFYPALHDADTQQLVDSRVIVECGVLPHVLRRMAGDPAIEATLQGIVDEFRATRDPQIWIELDIRFHRTLLEFSGLEPLVAFGDLLQAFFQQFRDSIKRVEWKLAIDSHQRIVDLLSAQDEAGAEAELRRHIQHHMQRRGAAS